MGKLNYTNRKIDGVKLGAVVARDLRKRATTFSKRSDALRDSAVHEIEINLAGKNLTDDGLRELVHGLENALQYFLDGNPCTKLEELNLANNALTTRSLALLARVIQLAKYDLKDLDLSDNKIQVKTREETQDWGLFLDSFSGCRDFRRLDLTGNDLSGPLPFEIFARVYSWHAPIDPTDLQGERLVAEAARHVNGDIDSFARSMESLTVNGHAAAPLHDSLLTPTQFTMSAATILKRRCGLRSVPYIILSDTALSDSGALWLSYILARHYFPQQLMSPLKPGPVATQLEEYRHRNNCWGLVYVPNESLGSSGDKVMMHAEAVRQELLGITDDPMAASVGSMVHVQAMQATRRQVLLCTQTTRRNSFSATNRRPSMLSLETGRPSNGMHDARTNGTEIDRLRNKIQRAIIEDTGPTSVQLWAGALKMLVYGRAILLGERNGRSDQHTFASKLAATASAEPEPEPIFAITGVTNTPTTATVIDYTALSHANGTKPQRSILKATTNGKMKSLDTILDISDTDYRDNSLCGGLTMSLWQRVLVLAAEAEGLMTSDQQSSVLRYAQDRSTLEKERMVLAKPDSVQIWMVLDSMNCLAYEIRT
ncbi:hypothetical protein H2199_008736 [Coniosporium tulheliwenetii]|uniref:Uncharacterized protein n=1 Tax=Coniosporium tulheliwenetii TaxID=3383036 RepID=A0ACC2YJ71_9PEZI|nr:hypothetical protein H2199_008736 [Cladosporium sp. JES 115]